MFFKISSQVVPTEKHKKGDQPPRARTTVVPPPPKPPIPATPAQPSKGKPIRSSKETPKEYDGEGPESEDDDSDLAIANPDYFLQQEQDEDGQGYEEDERVHVNNRGMCTQFAYNDTHVPAFRCTGSVVAQAGCASHPFRRHCARDQTSQGSHASCLPTHQGR